jgi:O-antigen ligase/polysaccharide polymerase Wzy-like membrane protein
LLAFAVVTGMSRHAVMLLAFCLSVATVTAVYHPAVLRWRQLVATLILIILFIPMRRYSLPGSLPFQLEPYRLFVALVVVGWLASLLIDRRLRFRRTGFEAPLALVVGSVICSDIANPGRVASLSSEVAKSLTFFVSFVLVLYMISSVVRRLEDVDYLVKRLVFCGGVVGFFAVIEARTGFNVFNHLSRVVPFLHYGEIGGPAFIRMGTAKLRVFGSAEHPIALSAALVMLIPLAIYLWRRYRQRRWCVAALTLTAASASTVSRTGVVMLLVVATVFIWLRPRQARRVWPAIFPALIVIHFAVPGTLGAIKQSFLPKGGLVAEQKGDAGGSGSGRVADLGPGLRLWQAAPLLGQGYGTQVVNPHKGGIDANIFDDQWLGTLLATGAVGFFGWLWFFTRVIRRLAAEAKRDDSDRGSLLTAIAGSVAAYAIGMTTFDAFAFVQVTFLLFILTGLASALLAERPTPLAVRIRRNADTLPNARLAPAGDMA